MEAGATVSSGIKRSREESAASRSSSKKAGSFIGWSCAGAEWSTDHSFLSFTFRLEWFRSHLSVGFLQEYFHSAFRLFQLFLAFARKPNTFLKKFHRFVKRKLRDLQLAYNFFEASQRALEIAFLGRLC